MKVIPYSDAALAEALSNRWTSHDAISVKRQYIYLCGYLKHEDISAHTIVIEEEYISRDYLHDYASYYAFCFEQYGKSCQRVHFFRNSFDQNAFNAQLLNNAHDEDFWKEYLGFIVVKPLPGTVLGYTVLKTYLSNGSPDGRKFWGIRDYIVHVFGNEVKIRSLAYQEQDTTLAACATTAVWSMLNKAASDYHTVLKSPSQITKDADTISIDGSRLFPNKGLNLIQICKAIENSGLVCEVKNADFIYSRTPEGAEVKFVSNSYMKRIIHAYAPIGIPILLIINVPTPTGYGLHAITVSGVQLKQPIFAPPVIGDSPTWRAADIEKIYVHDDQYGPFVRVTFKNEAELSTPWTDNDPAGRSTFVTNLVVPLYPKIRIAYEDIQAIVLGLDRLLSFGFDPSGVADIVWDVRLELSENYKGQIKKSVLSDDTKLSFLNKSLPKYIWIASCSVGETEIFDFVFDATGLNNAMLGLSVISYLDEGHRLLVRDFIVNKKPILSGRLIQSSYYDFLIEQLS